jgi:inorganic pyrophosphatase
MSLYDLPPGPDPPGVVFAVIEIPQGGSNKFEYDATLGVFRLDRVLYSAVHYPGAYGFIPGTLGDDGDPLDILVLSTEPMFTGAVLEARPVGMLRMRDEAGEDEKVLAVPVVDPRFDGFRELDDVPSHSLREIEHFFHIYKDLEGKPVETFGWEQRSEAESVILRAIRAHV